MIYLDDGICFVPADRAEAASELIRNPLKHTGFVAYLVKS